MLEHGIDRGSCRGRSLRRISAGARRRRVPIIVCWSLCDRKAHAEDEIQPPTHKRCAQVVAVMTNDIHKTVLSLFELSTSGSRALMAQRIDRVSATTPDCRSAARSCSATTSRIGLPELSELQAVRHFTNLSQK